MDVYIFLFWQNVFYKNRIEIILLFKLLYMYKIECQLKRHNINDLCNT